MLLNSPKNIDNFVHKYFLDLHFFNNKNCAFENATSALIICLSNQ